MSQALGTPFCTTKMGDDLTTGPPGPYPSPSPGQGTYHGGLGALALRPALRQLGRHRLQQLRLRLILLPTANGVSEEHGDGSAAPRARREAEVGNIFFLY